MQESFTEADLQSSCASLGCKLDNGTYRLEPDCIESLRDIIRYLKIDKSKQQSVRKFVGKSDIFKHDLIPIIKRIYCSQLIDAKNLHLDEDGKGMMLINTVIRLMINLTEPTDAIIDHINWYCDDLDKHLDEIQENEFEAIEASEIDETEMEQNESFKDYKNIDLTKKKEKKNLKNIDSLQIENTIEKYRQSLCDSIFWECLVELCTNILSIEPKNRTENDVLFVERVLFLLRNSLICPYNLINSIFRLFKHLNESGMTKILLYIASHQTEKKYAMLVCECVSLIFYKIDMNVLVEKNKEVQKLKPVTNVKLSDKKLLTSPRHSRFGGTYTLNCPNEKSGEKQNSNIILYSSKPMCTNDYNLDSRRKKGSNWRNRPIRRDYTDYKIKRNKTFEIFAMYHDLHNLLYEFIKSFLTSSFNFFIKKMFNFIKISQNSEHDCCFFQIITIFLKFTFYSKKFFKYTTQVLNISVVNYIMNFMDDIFQVKSNDGNFDKLRYKQCEISLESYTMIILITKCMLDFKKRDTFEIDQEHADLYNFSKSLAHNIIYLSDHRNLLVKFFKKYEKKNLTFLFLNNLNLCCECLIQIYNHLNNSKYGLVQSTTKGLEKETTFELDEFILKFAQPRVLQCFILLLGEYKSNSPSQNKTVLKMLHRLGHKYKLLNLMYTARMLYIIKEIYNYEPFQHEESIYNELTQFADYFTKHFVQDYVENPNILVESLFTKKCKVKTEKNVLKWTEQQDFELARLFNQLTQSESDSNILIDQNTKLGIIKIIKNNLIDSDRSVNDIKHRLIQLELVIDKEHLNNLNQNRHNLFKRNVSQFLWTDDMVDQLKEVYNIAAENYNETNKIINEISDNLFHIPKTEIKKKLQQLSLINGPQKFKESKRLEYIDQLFFSDKNSDSSNDAVDLDAKSQLTDKNFSDIKTNLNCSNCPLSLKSDAEVFGWSDLNEQTNTVEKGKIKKKLYFNSDSDE
ncbi:hypothetical protein A3Q56_02127 [Intoshia linei]|uniref:Timeless N-terminal domain-containing protein n=1 Tax=Intoshia linei TaxID=1819745 RepID=A0A177B799_9BILA|nr:hypothetical protein A3Q56_02127 [Intoshia linei]